MPLGHFLFVRIGPFVKLGTALVQDHTLQERDPRVLQCGCLGARPAGEQAVCWPGLGTLPRTIPANIGATESSAVSRWLCGFCGANRDGVQKHSVGNVPFRGRVARGLPRTGCMDPGARLLSFLPVMSEIGQAFLFPSHDFFFRGCREGLVVRAYSRLCAQRSLLRTTCSVGVRQALQSAPSPLF